MRTFSVILVGVGVALSAMNWLCLIESWRKRRFVSPVFPAPSVLTFLGCLVWPTTRPYAWLALVTDYSLFSLIAAAPTWVRDAWQTSPFTRVSCLEASDPPRHFSLSLHRRGRFLLKARFDPPIPCNEQGALVSSYGAVGMWQATGGGVELKGYAQERQTRLRPDGGDYLAHETNYPEDRKFRYDALSGLRFRSLAEQDVPPSHR